MVVEEGKETVKQEFEDVPIESRVMTKVGSGEDATEGGEEKGGELPEEDE